MVTTPIDLFAPLAWSVRFDGIPLVYVLRWQDKLYVGSTRRLRGKISDIRALLRSRGVFVAHVMSVEAIDGDVVAAERAAVKRYNSVVPHGHNKTTNGQGSGTGRNPASAVPAQRQGDKHYDLFRSSAWAIPYRGKCIIYVIEWAGKKYVGSTTHLSQRIDVHRRALSNRGVTTGRILHYQEVPVESRFAEEANAIAKWKSVTPTGHNKTPNGRGTWTDEARNIARKKHGNQ